MSWGCREVFEVGLRCLEVHFYWLSVFSLFGFVYVSILTAQAYKDRVKKTV